MLSTHQAGFDQLRRIRQDLVELDAATNRRRAALLAERDAVVVDLREAGYPLAVIAPVAGVSDSLLSRRTRTTPRP